MLIEVIAVVIGVFFMFVASLGVLRLGDFYARIHAPTKAATLGLAFLLASLAIEVRDKVAVSKAVLAMLFIGMTAPVGAHVLARAAYRRGLRPSVRVDQYANYVAATRTGRRRAPSRQENT